MALPSAGSNGRTDIYLGPPRPRKNPNSLLGKLANQLATTGSGGKNFGLYTDAQVHQMTGDGIFRRMMN